MHGGADGSGAPKGAKNGNYKHGRYTERFKQLAAGCARPHDRFAVLGEGRRKSRPESRIHNWVGNDFCSRALAVR
jgi:hypothetical protein